MFQTRAAARGAKKNKKCERELNKENPKVTSTPHLRGSRKGKSRTQSGRSQVTRWVVPKNLSPLVKGVYRVQVEPTIAKTKKGKAKMVIWVEVRNLDNRLF